MNWLIENVLTILVLLSPSEQCTRVEVVVSASTRAGGDGGARRAFALPLFGGPHRK